MDIEYGRFIWNVEKEILNVKKHGISFVEAVEVFRDKKRKIIIDGTHSHHEERFFCIGRVGNQLITVRFTYRAEKVRIIGAGYWRMGGKYYEKES